MTDVSRTPRRILHTSDLHLAWPGDDACDSLKALVDIAGHTRVDSVIIAGDLFDHYRVPHDLVCFVVEQFQRVSGPVVILPGNHDCLVPGSPYERSGLLKDCKNVRVFRESGGETLDLPDVGISLWGRPIDTYDYYIRPLERIPRPPADGRWHVAVAHGWYIGDEPRPSTGFNITRDEIVGSGQDYVALGHQNDFQCVCDGPVKAYYSGTPCTATGKVAIVDLAEESGVRVTPYPLARL